VQYPKNLKTVLEYIERNLKTDITAEELARMANYSTFHFCRLFSSIMGSSVSGYILKRRLDHALSEIACGRKAMDVVLEYGFDTYAGFYKAFVRMYGCSPKKYLRIYKEHKVNKPEVVSVYSEKDIRSILEHWDIEKNLPVKDIYIMDGAKVSGNVWTVGNDYILKTGKREALIKNLRIAKELHKLGFSSSLPVLTKDGKEYVDNEEIFVLTHGIKGSPLPKSERFGENRYAFGLEYGKSIAKLHKALKAVQKEVSLDETDLYRHVTNWALPNVKKQNIQWSMGIDESFFDDYVNRFGVLFEKLPKQLIHRCPDCPAVAEHLAVDYVSHTHKYKNKYLLKDALGSDFTRKLSVYNGTHHTGHIVNDHKSDERI
jgi:AraC-like DNA-binding protein